MDRYQRTNIHVYGILPGWGSAHKTDSMKDKNRRKYRKKRRKEKEMEEDVG